MSGVFTQHQMAWDFFNMINMQPCPPGRKYSFPPRRSPFSETDSRFYSK